MIALIWHKISQRRWSRTDRIWLWSSAWCMGLFGLYGLCYGTLLGALFTTSSKGAMIGALASSLIIGTLINGVYQIVATTVYSRKILPSLLGGSLIRGASLTLGVTYGVLLGGGIGLAIACLAHLFIMRMDCRQQPCVYSKFPNA
ncbi:MAG: hypothetical protein AAF572_05360 [Cyanobacteria bacterium P01_B01_bin.77]